MVCSCPAGGRLHQEPAPELAQLRLAERSWTAAQPFTVLPGRSFPVPRVHGASLEVLLTLQPGSEGTTAASVLLHSEPEASVPLTLQCPRSLGFRSCELL